MKLNSSRWLCYPAKVCDLVIYVFFHHKFMDIGSALSNLFVLAKDKDLERKPDAIYVYGAPPDSLKKYSDQPTVFYDDKKTDMLVGAVPRGDDYGYFGYLKKMILTLHNSIMIKRGRLPVHAPL